jgi:hypothetical protein
MAAFLIGQPRGHQARYRDERAPDRARIFRRKALKQPEVIIAVCSVLVPSHLSLAAA